VKGVKGSEKEWKSIFCQNLLWKPKDE